MLLIRARVVPQAARASWVSLAGSITMPASVCLALTISINVSDCSPLGPLTDTWRSLIETVTPLTGAIGFLPVRDILVFLRSHRLTQSFKVALRRRGRVPRHPDSGTLLHDR